jgi:hypothetical protein
MFKGLSGVEKAMLADEIEATEGISRLWEDEDGIFTADEAMADWEDVPDYMYGIDRF